MKTIEEYEVLLKVADERIKQLESKLLHQAEGGEGEGEERIYTHSEFIRLFNHYKRDWLEGHPTLESNPLLSPHRQEREWQIKNLIRLFPDYPNGAPAWQYMNALINQALRSINLNPYDIPIEGNSSTNDFGKPAEADFPAEKPTEQGEKNQCDGCNAGIPVDENGMHRMGQGKYADYMFCQKSKYQSSSAKSESRDEGSAESLSEYALPGETDEQLIKRTDEASELIGKFCEHCDAQGFSIPEKYFLSFFNA